MWGAVATIIAGSVTLAALDLLVEKYRQGAKETPGDKTFFLPKEEKTSKQWQTSLYKKVKRVSKK